MCIHSDSKVEIDNMEYAINNDSIIDNYSSNADTLVIAPGYPSSSNLYSFGFVHTATKAYIQNNMTVDVFTWNIGTETPYQYKFDDTIIFSNNFNFVKPINTSLTI